MSILFQIRFASAAKPSSYSESKDNRELAIKFSKLRIFHKNTDHEVFNHNFNDENHHGNIEYLYGFGNIEESGIWSIGKKSAFAIIKQELSENLRIEVDYSLLDFFSKGINAEFSLDGEAYTSVRLDGTTLCLLMQEGRIVFDQAVLLDDAMGLPSRTAIVVLGMHRSGTSALTRLLSLAGASLPHDLMLPMPDNPTGFWESNKIVSTNDLILKALGSSWDDPLPVVMNDNLRRFILPGLTEIIAQEYEDAPLIIIKDPRMSLMADLWDQALRRAGYRVHYLTATRHPLGVAQSLLKRNRMSPDYSVLLWTRYVLAVLSSTVRSTFVTFDDIMERPIDTIRDVAKCVSHEFAENAERNSDSITKFINKDYNNINKIEGFEYVDIEPAIELYESIARYGAETVKYDSEFERAKTWYRDRARLMKSAIDHRLKFICEN